MVTSFQEVITLQSPEYRRLRKVRVIWLPFKDKTTHLRVIFEIGGWTLCLITAQGWREVYPFCGVFADNVYLEFWVWLQLKAIQIQTDNQLGYWLSTGNSKYSLPLRRYVTYDPQWLAPTGLCYLTYQISFPQIKTSSKQLMNDIYSFISLNIVQIVGRQISDRARIGGEGWRGTHNMWVFSLQVKTLILLIYPFLKIYMLNNNVDLIMTNFSLFHRLYTRRHTLDSTYNRFVLQ